MESNCPGYSVVFPSKCHCIVPKQYLKYGSIKVLYRVCMECRGRNALTLSKGYPACFRLISDIIRTFLGILWIPVSLLSLEDLLFVLCSSLLVV